MRTVYLVSTFGVVMIDSKQMTCTVTIRKTLQVRSLSHICKRIWSWYLYHCVHHKLGVFICTVSKKAINSVTFYCYVNKPIFSYLLYDTDSQKQNIDIFTVHEQADESIGI